jgi:hypothetical protein
MCRCLIGQDVWQHAALRQFRNDVRTISYQPDGLPMLRFSMLPTAIVSNAIIRRSQTVLAWAGRTSDLTQAPQFLNTKVQAVFDDNIL